MKRDDAQFLLETLAENRPPSEHDAHTIAPSARPSAERDGNRTRVQAREPSSAPLLVWESGDVVEFDDLVRFLKITGSFEEPARAALTRLRRAGAPVPLGRTTPPRSRQGGLTAQGLLDRIRLQWGWESAEEAHVTMRDLGLGIDDVAGVLEAESVVLAEIQAAARQPTDDFAKGLRIGLWADELALKREVLRLGALRHFAAVGSRSGAPTPAETMAAQRCIARLRGVMQWSYALIDLSDLGLQQAEIDDAVRQLAWARRAAPRLLDSHPGWRSEPSRTPRSAAWRDLGLDFQPSPKAGGSRRFTLAEHEAAERSGRIARQMGIVRIGLVGELSTLGVHVAQAFGERSGWSSTFSSGKAETREGARTGSIMEEAELHAQDAYRPSNHVRTSYAKAAASLPLIDPETLALPFDSRYEPTADLDWSECVDLLGAQPVLVPTACLSGERVPHDIYYSPRLGGKVFSSSGLGSGFTLAEAAVHALAELIERHAQRLAEIELDNPGGVGVRSFWFIDEETLPETPRRIIGKYAAGGMTVRILDMTSDIAVPTFYVRVFEDPFLGAASTSSDGFACHPDPEVAITMALLEAAQTQAGFIAGGREDFSLQARSLGRHERPRTALVESLVFWFGSDPPVRPFEATQGYQTSDVLDELEWLVDQVAAAGYPHVCVADLTMSRIAPAYAVRALIPGTETTNPLHTGPAARATCIRDLLPRGPRSSAGVRA